MADPGGYVVIGCPGRYLEGRGKMAGEEWVLLGHLHKMNNFKPEGKHRCGPTQ